MAGIPSLRSSDLEGLLQTDADETLSPLRVLVLNNTGVDDGIAPFISACAVLETLELASTKVTGNNILQFFLKILVNTLSAAGLFPIIDACTQLQSLNLTSCRGVSVVDRRRFFEV